MPLRIPSAPCLHALVLGEVKKRRLCEHFDKLSEWLMLWRVLRADSVPQKRRTVTQRSLFGLVWSRRLRHTASSEMSARSENVVVQKYDRCLADLIVKAGVGFGVGVVASVVLFRRRAWPITLSTGFGLGTAYADCDRSFNPARIRGTRILSRDSQTLPEP